MPNLLEVPNLQLNDDNLRLAFLEALNQLYVDINSRIFNANKDVLGKSFGGYSEKYAKYRKLKGRQTSNKDLQLTDESRLSIVKDEVDFSIRITLPRAVEKLRSNEKYLMKNKGNAPIFEPSNEEIDRALEAFALTNL